MKMKLSVTIAGTLVKELDKAVGSGGNRSALVETALREFFARRRAEIRDARDAAIYRKHADEYNEFIDDMLERKWGKR